MQEPDHVRLSSTLDEVVVLPALGVEDFHGVLWLNLSHQVHIRELADVYRGVSVLVEVCDSQKVITRHLVVEDRAVVHVVLQHSETLVLLWVNLSQKRSPFLLLLEDLGTIRTHVREIVRTELALLGECRAGQDIV